MRRLSKRVHQVAPRLESSLAERFLHADFADAYAIALGPEATRDIGVLARAVLGHPAPWMRMLMRIRDTVVAAFGAKTSGEVHASLGAKGSERINFFRVVSRSEHEMVVGEDDKHLDLRACVLVRPRVGGDGDEVVLAGVVRCHNPPGRAYLLTIMPFHRRIMRSMLRGAARRGWPPAAGRESDDLR